METKMLSAPPNIMFVLDNSGSMDWEFMTDQSDGLFEGDVEYVFDDPGDNNYQSGSNSATGALSNQSSNVTVLEQTEIDFRTVSGHDLRTLSNNTTIWGTIADSDTGQTPNPGSGDCSDGSD